MIHEAVLSDFGRAAVDYAKRGWHVSPAPAGKKQSLESAANNDGRRWGCTNDPEQAMALFAKYPDANLGIATQESVYSLSTATPKATSMA